MKLYKICKTTFLIIFSFVFLSSCSKEELAYDSQNSMVNVKFKGTQSQLSRLNLEILDVKLRVLEDETAPNAWISLNTINTGVHDLTSYTQDEIIPLVDFGEIPSGFIYNIKVVYGDQNMVVKNGVEYDLEMASDCQNASVNIIEKQLRANTLYDFVLEFETDKSISFSSNGNANIQPKMNTVMSVTKLY